LTLPAEQGSAASVSLLEYQELDATQDRTGSSGVRIPRRNQVDYSAANLPPQTTTKPQSPPYPEKKRTRFRRTESYQHIGHVRAHRSPILHLDGPHGLNLSLDSIFGPVGPPGPPHHTNDCRQAYRSADARYQNRQLHSTNRGVLV